MNARERLKEAYENVSLCADRTWINSPNVYHKSNLELYLTENYLQRKKLKGYRPRTVRESIPRSRLAIYSNYVYNESSEMSYASSNTSISDTHLSLSLKVPTEAWEMPHVGELYKWFTKNQPEDRFSRRDEQYESPLLKVTGFEDKILKIQLSEDRIKNIWKNESFHFRALQPKTKLIQVNVITSPINNIYLFDNANEHNCEWFRNMSLTKDFAQLEQLSNGFRNEIASIAKFLGGSPDHGLLQNEPSSTEILYSEVLQGLSPNRKLCKMLSDETSSQESLLNYTVLTHNKSDFAKCQTSNKLPKSPNVSFQNEPQSYPNYKIPVETNPRNVRSSVVNPFSTYVQQTYFYSPVQTVQRWIPSNCPAQMLASSWFTQNSVVPNRAQVRNPSEKSSQVEETSFKDETTDIDSALEEHPVSASISEELELQALEQYSNSNENFYQELERQAAEQYASSPE